MTTEQNTTPLPDVPPLADPASSRQTMALYDDETIRVYQAYSDAIADAALSHGRLVSPPFSMNRMTWIKPSFLWMMYRAGWGHKDENQRRILAIDIRRDGFNWALAHSCPSHPDPSLSPAEWRAFKARTPVRIQWDPDRDLWHRPQQQPAIQVGLSGEAVRRYVDQWICRITDISALADRIAAMVAADNIEAARALLPHEQPYLCELPAPWIR